MTRPRALGARALGAALLVVSPALQTLLVASPVAAAQAQTTTLQMAMLLRATRAADAPPSETTVAGLAAFGDALVGPALEMLTSQSIPRAPGTDGDEPQMLNRFQRQMLLDALGTLPRAVVLIDLESRLERGASVAERTAGLRVVGAVGVASDVATMLALAQPVDAQALDTRILSILRESLAVLVRRDAATIDELAARRASLATQCLPMIVLAIGDADEPRGVDLLVDLMRARPDLVCPVAAQIVKLGPSPSPEVNREGAALLVEHLRAGSARSDSTVALALGSLEAPTAVPELIVLLDSDSRGTRENALVALRRLSGLGFAGSSDVWRIWFQDEANWYHASAPKLLRELDSSYVPCVTAALRELSQRRLFRHELARRVAPSLTHWAPQVRALTCRTLAELGSQHVVPSLVDALEDGEPTVRQACCEALRVLTGLDHAADSPAWHDLASARG